MDLRALADKYGGLSPEVTGKAMEYMRMLDLKMQGGKASVSLLDRPAACLELACDKPRQAQAERAAHFKPLRIHANHNATVTTAALCVKFGCPALTEFVAAVHDDYKHRMASKLSKASQQQVDFSRPLFPIAVFYVCAQKANHRVDKAQLIQMTFSHPNEFASVASSIERVCDLSLSRYTRSEASLKIGRKRKRKDLADTGDDDGDAQANKPKENAGPQASAGASATRSLDQIKKLIQLRTSAKAATSVEAPTPAQKVPSPAPTSPAPSAEEYSDWKKKILARMLEQKVDRRVRRS
ncbi:hypothetical protein SPRG_10904 [Saprolegnia parasitica CBS 223.65]|uniref:ORC6 second cyclin-like domain-containing protein n=1 Tax=Saprolegnia parasitica (strain CBS 223.65) TaxID=695850 RepID=A0A067CC55_SAPPC|nr:hypothetical protein SPRG_10904 [Saprolegnia parasitica CBS 223.65]KDO24116.1 hypothetical protein SPRG_10904 [Saprolegnia parasitica CBS 223.65]|eukprot:XP_012205251.1 hypothetical protein SPRG_10904 [Saprolegnia parasitica CBS 223.65]